MKLHRSRSGPAALSAAELRSLGQFPKEPVPIVHSFPPKRKKGLGEFG